MYTRVGLKYILRFYAYKIYVYRFENFRENIKKYFRENEIISIACTKYNLL